MIKEKTKMTFCQFLAHVDFNFSQGYNFILYD